jgi:hypothetical protein
MCWILNWSQTVNWSKQRVLMYPKDEEPLATKLKTSVEEAKSYLNIYLFSAVNDDATYSSPEEMDQL